MALLIGMMGDLLTLVRAARSENPRVPLGLFEHSMGSVIVQAFLLDYPHLVDALVLSGSAAVDVVAAKGAETPDRFGAMNTPFEPGPTEFDCLSRNQAEVER
ncbi:alpha/beta hydrolase [Altererythrobacter sp. BO-6]|uniref:serine aminopeptidase domain-containing protein n=1 Tax=Altererythrobacter sp. BO-6 TaxID=2604537 RepID=UPI0013E1F769|nr:alpha/beta hydrolase [Altererythrobacter sp. BO-6]QIG54721.1 alpha/beta hydrolase [Altererythrobacter sp. BO-6]